MEKNLVLVDFECPDDWAFVKGLTSSGLQWKVEKYVSNGTHKGFFNLIKRYFKYFLFPIKFFLKRKKIENIIAWQQFYGIFLCYFLALFHSKCNLNVIILNFIYKPKKGIKGKIYEKFIRKALSANQLKQIGVLSTAEIKSYSNIFSIDEDKFFFAHIGLDKLPSFPITKGDYWLSAGRSNRDYDFLIKYFSQHKEYKLVILSDTYKNSSINENIVILDNCFDLDYEKKLAECFAVIVSLCDEPISSGQLVINNAFVYDKPVIVTKNPGVNDYIIDGENGYLINKDLFELDIAVKKLLDKKTYDKIANSEIRFSEYSYGKKVLEKVVD